MSSRPFIQPYQYLVHFERLLLVTVYLVDYLDNLFEKVLIENSRLTSASPGSVCGVTLPEKGLSKDERAEVA